MKKILVILSLLSLLSLGFISCKTTDDCPAYSNVNKNDIEAKA